MGERRTGVLSEPDEEACPWRIRQGGRWDAKEVELMRRIFAKIPQLPVDGIYPRGKVDAEGLR